MKSAKLAVAAAITAGGLTLATGLAVASGGFPGLDNRSDSNKASDTATTELEKLQTSLSTATANNDSFDADEHATSETTKSVDDEHATSDTVDNETSGTARPHNHGWFVSQVAQTSGTVGAQSTGDNHGATVSKEARTDDGKTSATVNSTDNTGTQASTTGTASEDHSGSHDGGHGAGD